MGMEKGYRPKKGFNWNPLLKWPRNKPCFCSSGKKFKKCCNTKMLPLCIPENRAKGLQDFIDKFGYTPIQEIMDKFKITESR